MEFGIVGEVNGGATGLLGLAVLLTLGEVVIAEAGAHFHGRFSVGGFEETVLQNDHLVAMNGHNHMVVFDAINAGKSSVYL